MTTIFNVLLFSLAILPFGIRGVSEGRIALRRLRVIICYLVTVMMKVSMLTCRITSAEMAAVITFT